MKKIIFGVLLAIALPMGAAEAATVDVFALANSSSGGVGQFSGLNLAAGEHFSISASSTDLWSAGDLPRWSNANGLVGDLFATGSDESGQPAATLIGQDFGLWSEFGLSAPYGSLVGEIGGVYEFLGTSFSGPAWGTGALNLYYWDSNNFDNSQFVTVTASVPEPVTLSFFGIGLVGAAAWGRRRKAKRML